MLNLICQARDLTFMMFFIVRYASVSLTGDSWTPCRSESWFYSLQMVPDTAPLRAVPALLADFSQQVPPFWFVHVNALQFVVDRQMLQHPAAVALGALLGLVRSLPL